MHIIEQTAKYNMKKLIWRSYFHRLISNECAFKHKKNTEFREMENGWAARVLHWLIHSYVATEKGCIKTKISCRRICWKFTLHVHRSRHQQASQTQPLGESMIFAQIIVAAYSTTKNYYFYFMTVSGYCCVWSKVPFNFFYGAVSAHDAHTLDDDVFMCEISFLYDMCVPVDNMVCARQKRKWNPILFQL